MPVPASLQVTPALDLEVYRVVGCPRRTDPRIADYCKSNAELGRPPQRGSPEETYRLRRYRSRQDEVMDYLLIDDTGNALDAFEDRFSAYAALTQVVLDDPAAARTVSLVTFDADGMPVGEVEVAADIPALQDLTHSVEVAGPLRWVEQGVGTFRVTGDDWQVGPPVTPAQNSLAIALPAS